MAAMFWVRSAKYIHEVSAGSLLPRKELYAIYGTEPWTKEALLF